MAGDTSVASPRAEGATLVLIVAVEQTLALAAPVTIEPTGEDQDSLVIQPERTALGQSPDRGGTPKTRASTGGQRPTSSPLPWLLKRAQEKNQTKSDEARPDLALGGRTGQDRDPDLVILTRRQPPAGVPALPGSVTAAGTD